MNDDRQTGAGRQLSLDLRRPASRSRTTFVLAEANAEAVALLDQPGAWHGGALALIGPTGSGKSHLASDWTERQDAFVYTPGRPLAAQLREAEGRAVLWEDADRTSGGEEAMFHLMNMAARGRALLVTGRTPPRAWPCALPDLRSRLNAMTVAELAEPDDLLMAALLRAYFAERSLKPGDDLLAWLVRRLERSAPAALAAVARLDEAAAAEGRPVTRVFATRVLTGGDEED